MKYHFIINPVAGKLDASKELVPEIHRVARKIKLDESDLVIQLTNRPSHAHSLALQAVKKAEEADEEIAIFAAGGDGTFNEVLSGAMTYPKASVGLLPYGSGNDFLRSFGERSEFCDLEDQFRGESIMIDMIKTQRGYAACICSAGLDAKVAYGIPKYRRIPFCGGEIAYKLSIVESLLGKRSTPLHINIDGKEFNRKCLFAAICNGHYYGGGFMAAPESKLDDGILDVLIVKEMPLTKIAKVLPIYQAGKHFINGDIVEEWRDVVEYFPARKVEIRSTDAAHPLIVNVDGECGPDEILTAEVVPLSARIRLPKKVYDRYKK